MTKCYLLCALLLFACAPALATNQSQPATATSTLTPADRAAMQHEVLDLNKRINQLATRLGHLSAKLGDNPPRTFAYRYVNDPDSGMLGLIVSREQEQQGLKVLAVTPGGPAEQAGVKAGDIIAAINGKAVKGQPGARATLYHIKAGTSFKLGVLRGSKHLDIPVKAEHREIPGWGSLMADMPPGVNPPPPPPPFAGHMPPPCPAPSTGKHAQKKAKPCPRPPASGRGFQALSPWWGLNLASLDPDLASYFGTQHGALVLSTQAKRYPQLKAGDVITAIEGKQVDQPEDVMRALRDLAHDKTVKLTVRRHGKNMSLSMKAPSGASLLPPPPPALPALPMRVPAPPPPPMHAHSS